MKSRKTSTTNRNITYRQIIDQLPDSRKMVYEVIKKYKKGITSKQIGIALSIPINKVTGRVTELQNMGLISSVGTMLDLSTTRPNTLWGAILNPVTFEMATSTDSMSKRKFRKVKHILDTYKNLLQGGQLLEHEIIEEIGKLI